MRIPIEEVETNLRTNFQENIESTGVFSFAGDPKSILMWSHYAGNHTGVCFQFERARDFPILSEAVNVEYRSEFPEINWVKNFPESLSNVILRKHDGWFYEKEQRILRPNFARKFLHFNPEALVAIIFGCNASKDHREVIQTLLNERARMVYSSVKIYEAQKYNSEYRLFLACNSKATI